MAASDIGTNTKYALSSGEVHLESTYAEESRTITDRNIMKQTAITNMMR